MTIRMGRTGTLHQKSLQNHLFKSSVRNILLKTTLIYTEIFSRRFTRSPDRTVNLVRLVKFKIILNTIVNEFFKMSNRSFARQI